MKGKSTMQKAIILVFLFLLNIQAQEFKFETNSSTLKGELTADDLFETDFGRFDAYELPLEDGDFIALKLKSSFFPLLTIVAPSNEYKVAFPKESKPEVLFKREIDESGMWQIYIAGDSTDLGKHSLQILYVSKDSRNLPQNADYCTLTEFFLSHTKTEFSYFKQDNFGKTDDELLLNINSQKLFTKGIISTKHNSTKLTLLLENNDELFQKVSQQLKNCLKKKWNTRDSKNGFEFSEIEGLRKISLTKDNSSLKLEFISK